MLVQEGKVQIIHLFNGDDYIRHLRKPFCALFAFTTFACDSIKLLLVCGHDTIILFATTRATLLFSNWKFQTRIEEVHNGSSF